VELSLNKQVDHWPLPIHESLSNI